jgi:hypothetical protein
MDFSLLVFGKTSSKITAKWYFKGKGHARKWETD